MLFIFDDGFSFFTQVGKQRWTDDQDEVFEEWKIEQEEYQAQHHTRHHEQKAYPATSLLLQPGVYPQLVTYPGNGSIGRGPEKIHANDKEKGINNTWNKDPFPELVFLYKTIGFSPGLKCYNYFFKQDLILKR